MSNSNIDWFLKDRFGMFIHWGLYSIPARGEWVRSFERISTQDYQKYYDSFNPTDYNPREWAKLAKEAGMKYAVMTAKHHDGFCLFDSKLTDYKSTNTKAGRDLVREYVEAFRAEGLKVGVYYSLLDWYHPDYPVYKDKQHPMRDNEEYKNIKQDFSRYVEYFHGQVKELLTGYGKIDIIWFDFSYEDEMNNMSGDKWEAAKLVKMVRELQPGIIMDDRLGGITGSIHPQLEYGDFVSPEQCLPRHGMTDKDGNSIPWEACITLNNHWGYCADDHDYKQAKDVVRALAECVSKNGNLILNVGPDANGRIPEESVDILKDVGSWMKKNGDSIYGCCGFDMEKPEWGRYTKKGGKLFAHILERGVGPINLEGLNEKIKSARYLHDGSEVSIIDKPFNALDNMDDAFLNLNSFNLPCGKDTVVEMELK